MKLSTLFDQEIAQINLAAISEKGCNRKIQLSFKQSYHIYVLPLKAFIQNVSFVTVPHVSTPMLKMLTQFENSISKSVRVAFKSLTQEHFEGAPLQRIKRISRKC